MFVGHLAVALGARSVEPRVPLPAAVAAAYALDLLWPILLLLGIETVTIHPGDTAFTPLSFDHYPWSHSLLMVLVWSVLAALVARRPLGSARAAVVLGGLVLSHWFLDLVVHRPDLPLWPGGPREGLGLWNHPAATLIVEGGLLAAGVWLYVRHSRRRDAVGRWALVGLVAFCTGIWVSQPLSPPPPGTMAIAIAGVALWLLVPWAGWIERHRVDR